MDTAAQHTERDRSSRPAATEPDSDRREPGGRSRFACARRLVRAVPGGRITLGALIGVLAALFLNAFVVQPFEIPSRSMENGLRVGDRVLVNKVAYRFGAEPRRGDVVVFAGGEVFGDADYVKRVVGTGGDHVVCCDTKGRIEVNGQAVDETGFLHPGDRASDVAFDVVVPEGRLFVLGDHRSQSRDSRDRLGSPGGGMVPVDAVIGRAQWVAWPLSHWGRVPRGDDAYARVPDAPPSRDTATGTGTARDGSPGTRASRDTAPGAAGPGASEAAGGARSTEGTDG